MKKIYSLLLIVSVFLASCSTFAPEPTATPTATFTPFPTETPIPTSTNTPKPPTATVDAFSAMIPSGTPLDEWRDIPIMPGAINGEEGDNDSYIFSTLASVDEVREYYEKELSKLGWDLMMSGESDNGSLMMIFNNGVPPLMPISIFSNGEITLVLIVTSQ